MSNRKPRRIVPVLLLATLAAGAAGAQTKFEITPTAGLRFGGNFETDGCCIFDTDLEVDDGSSLGVTFDIALNQHLQVEILLGRQDTTLIDNHGGFAGNEIDLFDLDVDYYHAGLLYQWLPGQIRPFIVMTLGATLFSPVPSDLDDEYRFSVSLGGGLKIMATENIGFRLEGRFYSTVIEARDEFCDFSYCYYSDDGQYMVQGELRAGLIFAF